MHTSLAESSAPIAVLNTGKNSPYYSDSDPLWFLNLDYQPFPEYDVEAGEYTFSYRPEYGTYFLTRGAEGITLQSIAAELYIPLSIIKQWGKKIKTFGVMLELAELQAMKFWETTGLEAMKHGQKGFNQQSWLKMMATRFPGVWGDVEAEESTIHSSSDEDDKTLIFMGVDGLGPDGKG